MKKCWLIICLIFALPLMASANWDEAWVNKQKVIINAQTVNALVNNYPVVVRLHSGNFDFTGASLEGSDIRFVAADDKTELKYFIEKYDAVNELAVIWVVLPKIDPADKDAHIYLYSGNESAPSTSNPKAIYDANTSAAYHFAEKTLLQDAISGQAASGEVVVQKAALIGEAATLNGSAITLAANASLKVSTQSGFTWSAWVKPNSIPQQSTLFNIGEAVTLKITDAQLSLTVDGVAVAGGELKSAAWQMVSFSLAGSKATVYLNGVPVATGDVAPVEMQGDIKVGEGFIGDIDELVVSNIAQPDNWLKLNASAQGIDSQLLKVEMGENAEGGEGEANYIGILVNSLTLDAKIVIAILAVMFAISVWVMWSKFSLVTRTDKDNKKFLARFQSAAPAELLQLDKVGDFKHSNLFMLYMAGLREIKKRVQDGKLSLSGPSMDAIKASIDAELVRETQRQNAGIVLLTIAISGGPFLGLLGTVVGVMITFAAIAAAGDVNVNAIAPGIAAALLATVAGLGVAIPALFAYNYLASRIKNITIAMQIFVDEYVTRVAEIYGK